MTQVRIESLACEPTSRSEWTLLLRVRATGGVGGTVAGESALRSAGTLLSWFRAPPMAPWPDEKPESLRSPFCGLVVHKN
ncbi:hypothetical protein PoB_003936200 [Plakobranchus ocellatus]|uniref:Uncharacterized protein n=1 Tax=Plakobranchus ocellatus TaxID=259542 RepID=A0AAV4B157_9GAST|nr:hypothetical protein PoB_003936200 [Plakobranchus ocellatus]